MPLDPRRAAIWKALNTGPEWVERNVTAESLSGKTNPAQTTAETLPERAQQPGTAVRKTPEAPVLQTAEKTASSAVSLQPVNVEAAAADWETLRKMAENCRACGLCSSRRSCVFAEGAPGCPVVIVGEAPGMEEDIQGMPFVGKSGQLLTLAAESIGLKRGKDIAVINVLKCRPPKNRDPEENEIAACRPYLTRQLELLAPQAVVLMGRFAAQTVLQTDQSIGRLRGTLHQVKIGGKKIPAVAMYHPSYFLRRPIEKRKWWDDLCLLRSVLNPHP